MFAFFASRAHAAEGDELRVWLVLNLAATESEITEERFATFLADWERQGIDLYELRSGASASSEFRRQVYGQDAVLHQLAAFRSTHPSFPRIEVTFFGWDEYWDKLRTTSESRRPDLLQVPSTWCSSLAKGAVLKPLSTEEAAAAKQRFERPLLDPCLVYGEEPLFGVPWLVDVRFLYYWRSDFPSLDEEFRTSRDVRDTFHNLLRTAKQTGANHPLFGLPTARDWELLHQTSLLVWGEGGDLIETKQLFTHRWSIAALREPGLRGALHVLGLAREGLITLPRSTRQELEAAFAERHLGSVISGPWLLQQLRDKGIPGDAVGVALPPFYQRDPVTFIGGSFLGVVGNRPEFVQPAVDLRQFLTTGDAALRVALAAGLVPADRGIRGAAATATARAVSGAAACATYFECLMTEQGPMAMAEVVEHALRAGRTYPAIPEWSTLEVPARLGSLYFFWQELAALQPGDSLDSSLRTLSDEWNDSLLADHRSLLRNSVAVAIAIVMLIALAAIVIFIRRRQKVQIGKQQEALAHEQQLRQQLQEKIDTLTREPAPDVVKLARMSELFQELLNPQPAAGSRRPLAIALPVHAEPQLLIIREGEVVKRVDGMTARAIERVLRRALLSRQNVFSFVTCAIDLWGTKLPENPKSRGQVLVSEMRDAFSEIGKVIARGKEQTYQFSPREQDYSVQIGRAGPTFIDAVRRPFEEAQRLRQRDPDRALPFALRAYEAQQELIVKDAEVVAAACLLGISRRHSLTATQADLLASAEHDLVGLLRRYRTFFENVPTLETLLSSAGSIRVGDQLREHWEELRGTLRMLEEAAQGHSVVTLAPQVKDAWRSARRHGEGLSAETAAAIPKFTDAFTTVLEYSKEREQRQLEKILELGRRFDPNGKWRRRYNAWVNSFPDALMMELTVGKGDESLLVSGADSYLARDFWRAVENDGEHVLLDMASAGDAETMRRLRVELRPKERPLDMTTCFDYLGELVAGQS